MKIIEKFYNSFCLCTVSMCVFILMAFYKCSEYQLEKFNILVWYQNFLLIYYKIHCHVFDFVEQCWSWKKIGKVKTEAFKQNFMTQCVSESSSSFFNDSL